MKLIFVNSLANGGGERIAVNIANELSKSEPVILATLEDKIEYDVNSNVEIISLKKKKFLSTLFYVLQLKKIIKNRNISFIQSHLYRANIINVLTKLTGENQFVQIVNHGDPLQYKEKGIKGIIMLKLVRLFYPLANQIIAISNAMNKNIKELINIKNQHKVITINNPHKIREIIEKSEEKPDALATFNFEYVVAMGRLIESKNFNLLIQAIKKTNFHLIIIGSGPQQVSLETLTTKLNISERVYFLGQLKNPFPILKNAFAFISASSSEGFPNSIIESLACSTPVIHTDCISGPREILQSNSDINTIIHEDEYEITQYGLLYRVGDVTGLINSLNYLSSLSIDEINTLRHNCKLRAYDFDSSVIVKKYFR